MAKSVVITCMPTLHDITSEGVLWSIGETGVRLFDLNGSRGLPYDLREGVDLNSSSFFVLEAAVFAKHAGYFLPMVRVRHIDSFNSYGLQLADHVAGAVFRMLEFNDDSFIRLIAPRIECGQLRF